MSISSDKSVNLFSFYSSADEELYYVLSKHLAFLKKQGLLNEIWHNHEHPVIEEYVNQAHIILVLLSIDFLFSDDAESTEVKRALERHKAGEARVIPIILRPVHFEDTPFGHFQVLPANAKAVTMWPNQDAAYFNISDCIRRVVEEIRRDNTTI